MNDRFSRRAVIQRLLTDWALNMQAMGAFARFLNCWATVCLLRSAQRFARLCVEQTGGVEQLDCRFSDAVIVLQTDDSCGRVLAYPDGSNEGIQWEIERSFQFLHTVAARSKLGSFVSVFDAKDEFPNIFSETEIGPGARIVEGVVVGNRFAIGANAVVLQEVPADSTAVGVPGHPFQRLTVRR